MLGDAELRAKIDIGIGVERARQRPGRHASRRVGHDRVGVAGRPARDIAQADVQPRFLGLIGQADATAHPSAKTGIGRHGGAGVGDVAQVVIDQTAQAQRTRRIDPQIRQRPAIGHFKVIAARRQRLQILEIDEDLRDRVGGRIADDIGAGPGIAQAASLGRGAGAERGDRPVDADVVIVRRQAQPRHEGRRVGRTERQRLGRFRVQHRVAAGDDADVGGVGDITRRAGKLRRLEVLAQILDTDRLRREQFRIDAGRADVPRTQAAQQQVVEQPHGAADLPRPDAAGVAVIRIARRAVQIDLDRVGEVEQRHREFAIGFLDAEAAVQAVAEHRQRKLADRIGRADALALPLAAPFGADHGGNGAAGCPEQVRLKLRTGRVEIGQRRAALRAGGVGDRRVRHIVRTERIDRRTGRIVVGRDRIGVDDAGRHTADQHRFKRIVISRGQTRIGQRFIAGRFAMAVMRAIFERAAAEAAVDADRAFIALAQRFQPHRIFVREIAGEGEAGLPRRRQPIADRLRQEGIGRLDREHVAEHIEERIVGFGAAIGPIDPDFGVANFEAGAGICGGAFDRGVQIDIVIGRRAVFTTDHRPVELGRPDLGAAAEIAQRAVCVEHLSRQHAGADQAGDRGVAEVDVLDQPGRQIGGAGRVHADGARAQERTRQAPVRPDAFIVHIFGADHEMAAAIGKAGAERAVEAITKAIAQPGNAGLRADIETAQLFVEDDVDHTRDRARTIGRRRAAGDDFDPADQVKGHIVEVVVANEAAPVEQGQRAQIAQATKIDRRGTRIVDVAVRILRHRGRAHLRLIDQHLLDVGARAFGQFGFADDRGRRRLVKAVLFDARSGDDQTGIACRFRIFLDRGGLCHGGAGIGQRHSDRGKAACTAKMVARRNPKQLDHIVPQIWPDRHDRALI